MRLRRPPVLGPHIIRKRLRLLVTMRRVAVPAVRVRVVGGADVLHAVDAAAFGAAFDGAVAVHLFCWFVNECDHSGVVVLPEAAEGVRE